MNENIFDKLDFGPFRSLLDNDDITDISYDNGGQIWIRSLTQGSMRVEIEGLTPEFVEKLAFQCSNVMGTTFNNAKPFLDAESAELRMNFVHQSIATNGIALVIRKTPAKIRLNKEKLIEEDYFTPAVHDFLIKCVEGHCNIMVAGETGSGKTEFVKYLASHTIQNEKIITIEDTLELHLDKIYPQRDIVAMKTNNVASYTDVLVTCMRQNPKWILLSEVRSAEAVSAVRNSISSGHNILSTIHADKASAIPYRLYSLMETDLDVHQFLTTIYRYIQLGVHIKAYYSKEYGQFHREVDEVCEFYVDENNEPISRIIYQKQMGKTMMCKPSAHLIEYLENQNLDVSQIIHDLPDELPIVEAKDEPVVEEKNNESEETPIVINSEPVLQPIMEDGVPGAKPDADEPVLLGADLGHEESVPVLMETGDVQLSNSAVAPVLPPTLADAQSDVQTTISVPQDALPQVTSVPVTPEVTTQPVVALTTALPEEVTQPVVAPQVTPEVATQPVVALEGATQPVVVSQVTPEIATQPVMAPTTASPEVVTQPVVVDGSTLVNASAAVQQAVNTNSAPVVQPTTQPQIIPANVDPIAMVQQSAAEVPAIPQISPDANAAQIPTGPVVPNVVELEG